MLGATVQVPASFRFSSTTMPSATTLWTLLLLLPAVPIALLYAQRRTSSPAGLSKGQKKRAKRAKRAVGAASGSAPLSISCEETAPLAAQADPAVPPASKSKKNKRPKGRTDADADAHSHAAIPGSFDPPAVPAATALASSQSDNVWQTTRKNKQRAPKSKLATRQTDQTAPHPLASKATPAPEASSNAPSSAPASATPRQAEAIDWGPDVSRNWTADAQWGAASTRDGTKRDSDSDSDSESESELGYESVPMPSSRGAAGEQGSALAATAAPAPASASARAAKWRKNKKPAAEVHPSEFFAPPPLAVGAPVEAEWERVPSRATRGVPSEQQSGPSGSASRFSSKNAFAMLHDEGEVPLQDGSAAKVIRIASSGPKPKAQNKRAAPLSEPTKKQRQNAAKRDAAKLAREEAEKERVAALTAHRRARAAPVAPPKNTGTFGFANAANKGLDKATLVQLAQGSRKQPSNGKRAQVDAHGHLVWE